MIALSLWVGGMSLFTFILTPVIFRSYPRDAAGEVVGKLFPSYFLFTPPRYSTVIARNGQL